MITYEVKDENGNVVAVFSSNSIGPFTVEYFGVVVPDSGPPPVDPV